MATSKEFELIYDSQVKSHLKAIARKYHLLIRHTMEGLLSYEPGVETRNRKPLLRPVFLDATWELRFGSENQFRVFYKINDDAQKVYILAIGVKLKERLLIGKEVMQI